GNCFLGIRFKESKFDIALNTFFEKNLTVRSYINGNPDDSPFKFGFNSFYFGVRPSIGFEQRIYGNFYGRLGLNVDLLTSNLISYGFGLHVFWKQSNY